MTATGDAVGLALVDTLIQRAGALPPSARERLLARAEALRVVYTSRAAPASAPPAHVAPFAPDAEDVAPPAHPWRDALEARAHARAPRTSAAPASQSFIAELRAAAATTLAADQVPEAAGPYNGAAIASRTLAELAALAPGYVSSYVGWLEDLASLADLPDRRAPGRKT